MHDLGRGRGIGPGLFAFGLFSVFAGVGMPLSAQAGSPFLTDDPEPVEYRHWEIIGFSLGTLVHGDSTGALPGLEINFGAWPDVQLHLKLQVAFNSQSVTGTQFGYGDSEIGVKYRFIDSGKDDWWPEVAIYPTVSAATGDASRGLGLGATHAFLPLWIQKNFDKWTTYGGGGYGINPGPGNKNYWFFGWELQRRITDNLILGAELFYQTAFSTAGPGSVGFPLGSEPTTGFDLGGTYDFSENYHLLFSAGHGIQNASTSNEFSYYIGIQWTF